MAGRRRHSTGRFSLTTGRRETSKARCSR
jgi:hypothetical protein